MGQKSKKILLEINAIETEGQVGVEVIRVKLKLSEACLMPVMLRGEIDKVERMQSKITGSSKISIKYMITDGDRDMDS